MKYLYYFLMLFHKKFSKTYNRLVYKIAILGIKAGIGDCDFSTGLCYQTRYICDSTLNHGNFPELIKQRPPYVFTNYWYSRDRYGHLQRIKALEEAIKLTKIKT